MLSDLEKREAEFMWWRNTDIDNRMKDIYRNQLSIFEFEGKNILEIGGGAHSGILPHLKAKRKVALDPLYVKFEQEGILTKYDDIEYVSKTLEEYEGDGFNAIIAMNVLDHENLDFDALDKLSQMLVKKGRIYIYVHLRKEEQLDHLHDHSLTVEQFEKAVKRNKLKEEMVAVHDSDPIDEGTPYRTLLAILQR